MTMIWLRRLGGVVAVALLAAAVLDAGALLAEHRLAQEIAAGTPPAAGDTRPRRLFAAAQARAAAGETLPALALYRQLGREQAPALAIAARYNSGNLYLREALRLRQRDDTSAQSLPLLELAKLAYRDVLRDEPQHWDARHNLEQALRLAPEGEEQAAAAEAPPQADRAVPTLMGIPQGQP